MTQPPPDVSGRVVALELLRSGRGVPVHAEAFPQVAARWGTFGTRIGIYRDRLELPGATHDKPDLVSEVANAGGFCDLMLTRGHTFVSDAVPRFAVADRDVADWFDNIGRDARLLLDVPDQELVGRVEAIYQRGVEVVYGLDSTSIRVPELDDSTLPDPYPMSGGRLRTFYDPEVSENLLADLVGAQGRDTAGRLLDSTYPRQPGDSAPGVADEDSRRRGRSGPAAGRREREGGR